MALHDLVRSNDSVPIAYQRDDQRRLITVTVTEPCSADDISSVIDRQAAEATWGYALLCDLRAVTDASTEANLQRIAERVKVPAGERGRGPMGIAIRTQPALFLLGMMYARLVKELVTVEVLLSAGQIDAWLVRNAPGGSSRGP